MSVATPRPLSMSTSAPVVVLAASEAVRRSLNLLWGAVPVTVSEQALEDRLNYNLERTNGMILIAQKTMSTQMQSLSNEVSRAANIQRVGANIDTTTADKIAKMQFALQEREQEIASISKSQNELRKRYDFDLIRYRQIKP